MSREDADAVAADLLRAEKERNQIGLVSLRFPNMTMDDAYAIQSAHMSRKLAEGRRIVGWKIGLTSRAMQAALGIETPDSGVLYDDMAFGNGATVPKGRFIQPRIEAEIAFVLRHGISDHATREEVLKATEFVTPALEILDTRITRTDVKTGTPRIVVDTISDNAANAGFVLGDSRFDPSDVDLRWIGAVVKRNGNVEATGLGAAVLDDPVESVVWLARRMAGYGLSLQAGQVVLSGSFIAPIECPSGTKIEADFGGFGTVGVAFE
ncbi:2-oxo-hept-4-ene-1,7-dioate hydratase [Celeribacter sp.]|uniref:2-oxo-hept-4-ene-1,7-dioate hydratase n=1 Tax=Celeribacter sp. TaxID=1890673 RepID=UPI003A8EC146